LQIIIAIICIIVTALLSSCDQQKSTLEIDPMLGFECFDKYRHPPVTQYEGIEKLAEDRLTIRIMNGVAIEASHGP